MTLKQALKNITIVYAEDDPIIRENITTFLKRRGGEVFEAENGKVALDLIMELDPQIILTDLEMPEMNGLEMIQRIRVEHGSSTPIIVITGYNDEEHHSDFTDHYIYKPVDLQKLQDLISSSASSAPSS